MSEFKILKVFFCDNTNEKKKSYEYLCKEEYWDLINVDDIVLVRVKYNRARETICQVRVIEKVPSILNHTRAVYEIEYQMVQGENKEEFNSLKGRVMSNTKNMFGKMTEKFKNQFISEISNIAINQEFKMGIRKGDDIFCIEMSEDGESNIYTNSLQLFSMDIPCIAMAMPVKNLAIGDIICEPGTKTAKGWVVAVEDNKYRIKYINGSVSNWIKPVIDKTFNSANVLAVKSMLSPQGNSPQQGMFSNPMVMMMLMSDDDGNCKGGMSGMMEKMMMMQMMNGGGGMNPFAAMFGGENK